MLQVMTVKAVTMVQVSQGCDNTSLAFLLQRRE